MAGSAMGHVDLRRLAIPGLRERMASDFSSAAVRRFFVRASAAHLSGYARDRRSVRFSNYLGIRLEPMRVVNSFLALALIGVGQARGPHLASG